MSSPLFSIVIPTYNRARFLDRCIGSVLNQSVKDWELIIVDDGSTDETKIVIENYNADSRIKYIYQNNKGVSAARNLGLKNVEGRYICFIDSDDEFASNHLEVFSNHISSSQNERFFYTNFSYKEGQSESVNIIPKTKRYDDRVLDNLMEVYLPYSPPVQTICVPAEVKNVISFNSNYALSECYDFCARCAGMFPVVYIDQVTVYLHGHDSNSSIPRNADQSLHFNTRQLKEFELMKNDVFYSRVAATDAFRNRFQKLSFEISKIYAEKKYLKLAFQYMFKGIFNKPAILFSLNFARFIKAFSSKLLRAN